MRTRLPLPLFAAVLHAAPAAVAGLQANKSLGGAEARAGLRVPGGQEDASEVLLAAKRHQVRRDGSKGALFAGYDERAYPGPRAGLGQQLAIPIAALVVGLVLKVVLPRQVLFRHLLMFFGAQSFMNIYMKAILSQSVVSEELQMRGFQGPLILTAMQQLTIFVCLWVLVLMSQLTPWKYWPRGIKTGHEALTIAALSVCFAANIALNNFSLSVLDLSASVMIRSLSPLSSLILQLIFATWFDARDLDVSPSKLAFMVAGVACALVAVLAKHGHATPSSDAGPFVLGVVLCVLSVVCSSMELIVVVIIGKGMKMNSIDTILYMSLPAFVLVLLPALFVRHQITYPGHLPSTDWQIFLEVWNLRSSTIVLVFLSGVFALWYNLLLYMTVRNISPFYATFAGNFNKVAAIGLALLLGFERLPAAPWNCIMVLAVVGNAISFTGYSLWPKSDARKGPNNK